MCELGVSEQTYYRWRNQLGGLKADDAKRLKDLGRANSTLKRLLADAELEKAALKEIAKGNFCARSDAGLPCTTRDDGRLRTLRRVSQPAAAVCNRPVVSRYRVPRRSHP